MDKVVNYLMKFKFVVKFVVKFGVDERTKGDIEALADARRALKNNKVGIDFFAAVLTPPPVKKSKMFQLKRP